MTTSKRTVKTPGAAKQPEVTTTEVAETTQPTTAQQADAALESITGADPSTNENAPEVALVPVEQFDAVAQKLAEAEAKIKELEAKSKASTKSAAPQALESKPAEVKHIHGVLTERGWDSAGG